MTATECDLGTLLLDEDVIQNPYPAYQRLREESPVYWSPALGQWLVTGYDPVLEVYRSHDRFSSTSQQRNLRLFAALPDAVLERIPTVVEIESTPALVTSDPPIHTRHRKHVGPPLTPRRLANMRDRLQRTCSDLSVKLPGHQQPDIIQHISVPFSYQSILGLFGAPLRFQEVFARVQTARRAFTKLGGGTPASALAYEAALCQFRDAMTETYEEALRSDNGGMIKMLMTQDIDGDRLEGTELLAILRIFLSAAQDNIISSVPTTIYALLRNREQFDLVASNPGLALAAFEEALRWDVPVQANIRVATTDCDLAGQPIHAGDRLMIYKAAANRDPSHFADPDRFDITRDPDAEAAAQHLAFGHGIHYCIGAGLARLEVPMMIAQLITDHPSMKPAPGWVPRYLNTTTTHQLTDLLVKIGQHEHCA